MWKRYTIYCPYCGLYKFQKRAGANLMPEQGFRFDCKNCKLYFNLYFEDDNFPKNPWIMAKILDKKVLLYCTFCGKGSSSKPNNLVKRIDKKRTLSEKNYIGRTYTDYACPQCQRQFSIFLQD